MSKKIVFMGTSQYATTIFKGLNLSKNYEIVALFTQPDRKVGRKQLLTPPNIKQFCINNNIKIPIYQPEKLRNDKKLEKTLQQIKPTFIVVAEYGQILTKEILSIAPCINLHASILPKYRGASPIQKSILNNDKYIGVTSMLMNEGLDSGDILGIKYLKLEKNMLVTNIFSRLSQVAANLALITLDNFSKILPKKQNILEVSFCKKIKKDDGLVDFKDAKKLFLKYKAYFSWPGVFLNTGLKLKQMVLIEDNSKNKEGEIIKIDKNFAIIGCLKGSLQISLIQPPSKKVMNITDYLRGKRLGIKDILA